jgi:hypothetical protein
MDLECEHASNLGNKMSSIGRAVMEIFNFLFDEVAFAPSCILFFPTCEKVKFLMLRSIVILNKGSHQPCPYGFGVRICL